MLPHIIKPYRKTDSKLAKYATFKESADMYLLITRMQYLAEFNLFSVIQLYSTQFICSFSQAINNLEFYQRFIKFLCFYVLVSLLLLILF